MLSTDAVLVLRCQKDDCKAFDEIVARYKDGIYNYICRMISNRDDAEDLAQEVFVRAYASMKSFRRDSNLRTWLFRIATNLCVDKYRKSGVEKQHVIPLEQDSGDGEGSVAMEIPDCDHDPLMICERTELQAKVQEALLKLPDKLRAPIALYDLEEMPYDEIAETLGCPIGTVKSRIFNARMQLRTLLKPYMEVSGAV